MALSINEEQILKWKKTAVEEKKKGYILERFLVVKVNSLELSSYQKRGRVQGAPGQKSEPHLVYHLQTCVLHPTVSVLTLRCGKPWSPTGHPPMGDPEAKRC